MRHEAGGGRGRSERLKRFERLKRLELPRGASRLIRSARTAHLATSDKSGQPHVVPICFAFDGRCFYSSIDQKPKRTIRLKRLRNIEANPSVALIIDHYDEDWSKLVYVLVFGRARILSTGVRHRMAIRVLRRKYPQYRSMDIEGRPVICIEPRNIRWWAGLSSG